MKTRPTFQYADAQLRDLIGHWVLFMPKPKPMRPPLVGFLFVHPTRGFLLRVEREVGPGMGEVNYRTIGRIWEFKYRQFRGLPLRKLEPSELEYFDLDDSPPDLPKEYSSTALATCRQLVALDPFRIEGNPDIVRGWISVDNAMRGREVLLRLEQECSDRVFDCRFLSKTQDGYEQGQSVCVVYSHVEGRAGLFCMPPYGPPTAEQGRCS